MLFFLLLSFKLSSLLHDLQEAVETFQEQLLAVISVDLRSAKLRLFAIDHELVPDLLFGL